jgi:hypothetical protein
MRSKQNMENHETEHPAVTFAVCLAAFCAAVVVGAELVRPVHGRGLSLWAVLGAAVLALTAVVRLIRQSRVRAARRWNAALDAYAAREIARARVITVEVEE